MSLAGSPCDAVPQHGARGKETMRKPCKDVCPLSWGCSPLRARTWSQFWASAPSLLPVSSKTQLFWSSCFDVIGEASGYPLFPWWSHRPFPKSMKRSAPKPPVHARLSLRLFFFFLNPIPVMGFRSVGTKARMSFRQHMWISHVRQPPISTHTHTHTHTHTCTHRADKCLSARKMSLAGWSPWTWEHVLGTGLLSSSLLWKSLNKRREWGNLKWRKP